MQSSDAWSNRYAKTDEGGNKIYNKFKAGDYIIRLTIYNQLEIHLQWMQETGIIRRLSLVPIAMNN